MGAPCPMGHVERQQCIIGGAAVCVEQLQEPELAARVAGGSDAHELGGGSLRALAEFDSGATEPDDLGSRAADLSIQLGCQQRPASSRRLRLPFSQAQEP